MARILFVDQYAQLGGAQRLLIDVVHYFATSGEECNVALPEDGPITRILRKAGAQVSLFEMTALKAGRKTNLDKLRYVFGSLKAQRDLVKTALEFSADLIYCNGPRPVLPTMMAARKLDLPMVAAVHLIFQGAERSLLLRCFRDDHVKLVTFCSEVAAEPFKELLGGKGMILPNWVSPHFFDDPATPNGRRYFDLEEGQIAVGILGRISKNKGQRLFLEAMMPLLDTFPQCRLLIGGAADFEDESEEQALKEMAKASHHSGKIKFLGAVGNAEAFLDALDVVVVASQVESFGLVAAEASARGKPVVCTRGGALAEVVEDGLSGIVVKPEACALGQAVQRLIEDPVQREQMGEVGRKRAQQQFAAAPKLQTLLEYCRLAGKVSS